MLRRNIKSSLQVVLILGASLAGAISCKTEDVDPAVTLSIDSIQNSRIGEDGGHALITATLNSASKKEVRVKVDVAGTAVMGTDYSLSANEIVIPSGSTRGSVSIFGIDDALVEGDETIVIGFSAPQNAFLLDSATKAIVISDDDTDTDHDGISDADDACPMDSGAVANGGCPPGVGLVINEVLYDPGDSAQGPSNGDANGDGIRDPQQDEFIELVNSSNSRQDISGFTVSDFVIAGGTSTVRYTFPAGTFLNAKKAAVVFGGGSPAGAFGGSLVAVCTETAGLSFGNTGEKIQVADARGTVLLTLNTDSLSNNPNESYTRRPDIIGDFVQHSTITPPGLLFSPGVKVDGTTF